MVGSYRFVRWLGGGGPRSTVMGVMKEPYDTLFAVNFTVDYEPIRTIEDSRAILEVHHPHGADVVDQAAGVQRRRDADHARPNRHVDSFRRRTHDAVMRLREALDRCRAEHVDDWEEIPGTTVSGTSTRPSICRHAPLATCRTDATRSPVTP
jgi:hypothetical protein